MPQGSGSFAVASADARFASKGSPLTCQAGGTPCHLQRCRRTWANATTPCNTPRDRLPFSHPAPRYFYITARKEHRGIGGLFFDDLSASDSDGKWDVAAFVKDVGDGILPSWEHIADAHRHQPFTDAQRQWQLLRRGRYLEFNLLYDRGVKFGLDGGRVESIMVSAPPLIAWRYNVVPEPGSPEQQLLQVLAKPREWA